MGARAERHAPLAQEQCSVPGCSELARCVGLCGACYQGVRTNRLRSTKDLMRYAKKVRRVAQRVDLVTGTTRRVVAFRKATR